MFVHFPTHFHTLNWKLEGYIWTSDVNTLNLRDLVGEKWLIFKISRGESDKIFPRLKFYATKFSPDFFSPIR